MPGKEGAPLGVDELAVREVEGYIERVEKKAESTVSDNQVKKVADQNNLQPATNLPVIPQLPSEEKQKVILPIEKIEIERGVKSGVGESVRWLSEWCVYMIKKYPGRIFYAPPK